MRFVDKEFDVPIWLQQTFNIQSIYSEPLVEAGSGIFLTGMVLLKLWNLELSLGKFLILTLLILDLTAGIVLKLYKKHECSHSATPKKRFQFILLHIIHPFVLFSIFPEEKVGIILITIFTIITSFIINEINNPSKQKIFSVILIIAGSCLALLLPIAHSLVILLLLFYIIKVNLVFA